MRKKIQKIVKLGEISLKSQGTSMLPTFCRDDILLYKKAGFNKIKINDIVLIFKNKKYFTHRVIYRTKKYLVTKGDNNAKSDGRIFKRQFIAMATKFKRKDRLHNINSIYLKQSSVYIQEIIKLVNSFDKKAVDYVVLKGLPLYLHLDKTYPKRIYTDCDLLIRNNHFKKATQILINQGYKKIGVGIFNKEETEITYVKSINGLIVVFDLHLDPGFLMAQISDLDSLYKNKHLTEITEEFLSRRILININQTKIYILPYELLIVYLALHIFHHNFQYISSQTILNKLLSKVRRQTLQKSLLFIDKYELNNFVYPVFKLMSGYFVNSSLLWLMNNIVLAGGSLKYIKNILLEKNYFDNDTRIKSGTKRFKNLFFLSPRPFWRRLMVFVNPQVIYSIYWICLSKLFFLKKYNNSKLLDKS